MMFERNSPARCFMTPPPQPPASWRSSKPSRSPSMPLSERKKSPSPVNKDDLFHIIHKVPSGDSPYVKAKQVQLVDKDPGRAISMFWAAINAGDRVESALKDMALVMKQLNRSDEAIEAIKSFRHLCPSDSQESLDNILVELYKRSGRADEEIAMLHHKLKQIEEGVTFVGRTTKQARSQGKKIQITAEQEISRILGNLAWAYMQKGEYKTAEEHYRKALSFEVDRNKQCNLAICLMHMNRITEAKFLLKAVSTASKNRKMDEAYAKSFERASEMLVEIESSSLDNAASSMRSVSQCSPKGFENLAGKSPGVVNRSTENLSVTSEGAVSHARRRLYQSPDPTRGDLNAPSPCTKPKKSSWGFNNGYRRETWGDAYKPSFGSLNDKHGLSPPTNGNWRARTMEDSSILKHGDTTVTGSSDASNTEAAMEFTVKEKSTAAYSNSGSILSESSDMVVDKPLQKKSWADIVEEEQSEELDFFSGYPKFDGEDNVDLFSNENEDSNIIYAPQNQTECSSKKLESSDQKKDGYASGNAILSRNPAARRSLFSNPETSEPTYFMCTSQSPQKAPRRNRLQVFQDITSAITSAQKPTTFT